MHSSFFSFSLSLPLFISVAFFIVSPSDRFKLQIKVTKNRNKFALGAHEGGGGLTDGVGGIGTGTGQMVDCWFDQAVIELL